MAAAHQPGLSIERPAGMGSAARKALATALAILLFAAILTLWIPDRRPLGGFQAGIYCLTIAAIVRLLWRGSWFHASRLLIPMGGVLALGTFQIAARQTSYMAATRASLLAWAANASLVFLAAQLFADRRTRRRFLRVLFYFGFAISVVALAQVWTSHGNVFWLFPTGYSDFVMGPFVSRNLYSVFIELLLPIGLFYTVSGRRAWMHAGMCGVMLASVIAGASRAGLAVTLSEVAAVLLLARMRGLVDTRGMAVSMGRFAAGCAMFVVLFGGTAVWQRLAERDPYGVRRPMLRSTLEMVRERPWTGFGLGTWSIHYPRFAYYDDGTVTSHAHNDWAEWAAEGGLLMLAMMVAVAGLTVRRAVGAPWGIGVLAVWAHCLVDSPLQNPVVAGWFFLMAGILAAGSKRKATPDDERDPGLEEIGITRPDR
jgi:O-antigen ligase